MKKGFTCGSFDLLHAGHILMLCEAKEQCDYLIVGLQTDPTIDRSSKNKPIQSIKERKIQLEAIKYIDKIIVYETESELYDFLLISDIDVRVLGADHEGKKFTGHDLAIENYFNCRDHGYSTSELRKRVFLKEREKWMSIPGLK